MHFAVAYPIQDGFARERHCLSPCGEAVSMARINQARFMSFLNATPISEQAMFDLQRYGFLQTRKWVPKGPFHVMFPLGSQVNRYESTVAYAYTVGKVFAFEVNRLMRADDWDNLFASYGSLVKCLWSYVEKMQESYGKEQTLYRGMVADEHMFRSQYVEGAIVSWSSFSSTSTDMQQSLEFAQGKYAEQGVGMPVLFVIETLSRGAPILGWSKYPSEDEVLLAPFQCFQVSTVRTLQIRGTRSPTLVIKMQTVHMPSEGLTSLNPGYGYHQSSASNGYNSSGGGANGECFPAHARAKSGDGSYLTVAELRIGDHVQVLSHNGISTSEVYSFGHYDLNREALFIVLHTDSGNCIAATPAHLVAVVGKGFVPTKEIGVGDVLYASTAELGDLARTSVLNISQQKMVGVVAPITMEGTIFIEGIAASCYSVLRHHMMFHLAMYPIRVLYKIDKRSAKWAHRHGGFRLKGSHIYIDTVSFLEPVVQRLGI